MKVGDLVIRKINVEPRGVMGHSLQLRVDEAKTQRDQNGHGLVTDMKMAGQPEHLCLLVWYPKVNRQWWIAASLMEELACE